MVCKSEYDPPGIGTISPMTSRYAEDVGKKFVTQIASVLEDRGLLNSQVIPFTSDECLKVRLDDYLKRVPIRKHNRHWIDGGRKIAIFHPITNLPFFINASGSKICKLCNGKYTVSKIIQRFTKEWTTEKSDEILTKDLMKFLLLLEELDLINFLE